MLPPDVIEELKPLLRLEQAEAGQIYKAVKEEIISLYGPRDEDVFTKAMALRLGNDKPSALGKKLTHILCPGSKPFHGCHCDKFVFGMWFAQMTTPIKSQLAGLKFNESTYKSIFKKADEVWMANGGGAPPAVVAAVAGPQVAADDSNPPQQVAAVGARGRGRGRGRGSFNNRGSGRGRGSYNQNQNYNSNQGNYTNQNYTNNSSQNNKNQGQGQSSNPKSHQKGPRHPDGPPDSSCSRHWSQGRQATYCSDPLNCGWVKIIAPRQPQNQN